MSLGEKANLIITPDYVCFFSLLYVTEFTTMSTCRVTGNTDTPLLSPATPRSSSKSSCSRLTKLYRRNGQRRI
jgi:hypothetical protein